MFGYEIVSLYMYSNLLFRISLDLFSMWLFTLKVVLKWVFNHFRVHTKLELVCCIWLNFDLQPTKPEFCVRIKLSTF